jgi:5-dehydro-2-deoxygluconokinase
VSHPSRNRGGLGGSEDPPLPQAVQNVCRGGPFDPPDADLYDLLAIGRSSLDLYAEQIGAAMPEVTSFGAYVGGCPTNVAVGTARLGLRAALLTAVGDDQVGDFVRRFLDREGVETRYAPTKVGRRTSAVVLSIQPPDRFPLTFYRDNCADRELTIGDVLTAPVETSRVLFLTGTGLSREPARSAAFVAAERAKAAGRTVVVDLDFRPDQWHDARAYAVNVRVLLHLADLVVGTEDEARAAAELPDADRAADRLLALGVRAVVLKRGDRGATVLAANGARTDVPSFAVTVVNVLGAGDAFASGFIYGYLQGWPLERAARMGNACGAIIVTRHGCANFMPTLNEVERFVLDGGGWEWAARRA